MLALLSLLGAAPAASPLLVTVAEVRPTAAVLWARAAHAGEVTFDVSPAGAAARRFTRQAGEADDLLVRVALGGLTAATRYHYAVGQGGERVEGEFGTAPPPGEPARVTLLWSGDLGGAGRCRLLDGGYRIFRAMARRPADFFLFVGDTVYADDPCRGSDVVPGAGFVSATLPQFRARHRYNREDPAVQDFLRRTPVYAIWDDHEVRNDFAGTTEPLMRVGRQAFLDYWPVVTGSDDATRLYRSVRWGRLLEVFILDTRQYRSDDALPDGPGKTMLGAAQRRWLVDAVSASTATWKVVVSSVPVAVPTGTAARRDSWTDANVFGMPAEHGTGFVTERDAILGDLRARGVANLVVLTADVHHAEVIRHQPAADWSFHEFIAGPLSARFGRPRPLDMRLNSRTLFAQGGVDNFGEITIEPAGLTVRLLDEQGSVMFTHTMAPR
ncbi:MAG TPA: alkaline phosphatase D family protein [Methylomirabilota bacterium]|nr:alkaline phosphatase D family protein [Methylomirabilota bacterium]